MQTPFEKDHFQNFRFGIGLMRNLLLVTLKILELQLCWNGARSSIFYSSSEFPVIPTLPNIYMMELFCENSKRLLAFNYIRKKVSS